MKWFPAEHPTEGLWHQFVLIGMRLPLLTSDHQINVRHLLRIRRTQAVRRIDIRKGPEKYPFRRLRS